MVAVFFFDFQKAFDIVDHDVLLKQLEHLAVEAFLINVLHAISSANKSF